MGQKFNGIFGQHMKTGLSGHVFFAGQPRISTQTAHCIMAH
jgi:hypothetical protein